MALRSGLCLWLLMMSSITRKSSADKVAIDIESGLPGESGETLSVRCGEEEANLEMKEGDHHKLSLPDSEKVVTCNAQWKEFFTSWWELYNHTRDAPHLKMFWSVKHDGFYRSWDGLSNWHKIDVWFTDI